MKLSDIFDNFNLEQSLLIGYYGGGNYGDELLLEVLLNLLNAHGLKRITVTYQDPDTYHIFHHEFGYQRVRMHSVQDLLKAVLANKNIVIGGGGLWGLDVNPNILRLSYLLFVSRLLLRKRVYLLGVGYYNSTSKTGHLAAWLAGKSSRHIIARDQESFENFKKVTTHVSLDHDMAWQIPELALDRYRMDVDSLDRSLQITQKTIFITLRRFKGDKGKVYLERIADCLKNNQDKQFIVAILEPQNVDPDNFARLTAWQQTYTHVRVTDFTFNPLALALFFKKHQKNLAVIGPQFHLILTAHLTNIPFLPIAYDNKVDQLLKQLGFETTFPITGIPVQAVQKFIDNFYGDK